MEDPCLLLESASHTVLVCGSPLGPAPDSPSASRCGTKWPGSIRLSLTGCGDGVAPEPGAASLTVEALLQENLQLRQQVGYWKSMHQRAATRWAQREAEIEQLQAKVKLRERQLFARKTERGPHPPDAKAAPAVDPGQRRRRGQQHGQPQPPRRNYEHLPIEEHDLAIPADQPHCPCCGLPWQVFPGSEDSTVIEVEVRAYRRRYRRQRSRPTCPWGVQPGIITAPGPDKVLPQSLLGISVWVTVLLDKLALGRPTHRLLEDLRTHDLELAAGTVTDGLQRLTPLFLPL
jgi:transposase